MASRVTKSFTITLMSDLCAGSGYSFAGVIDSDVCYDDCGIPYIPARRIKGCMREALDLLLYSKYQDRSASVFGTAGNSDYDSNGTNSGTAIRIGNAYPENYDALRNRIMSKKTDPFFSASRILDRFSRVIGQTRIVDGVADDTTLRYTRVINQYSPFGQAKPMTFSAEISYDEADEQLVRDVLSATRHIGLKRNRGMGNIRCELPETKDVDPSGASHTKGKDQPGAPLSKDSTADSSTQTKGDKLDTSIITEEKLQGQKTALFFGFENTSPLVLSADNEMSTEDYISGRSIIGALALEYLKDHSADSQEFRDLFLNGNTIYTDFYPFERGKIHYPAPDYIKRLKKTKKIVCTMGREFSDQFKGTEYDSADGNQPKRLSGKYVSVDGNTVSVCEVEKDIIYHHRHHNEAGELDERLLYGLEVIRAGQRFAGAVIVPDQYKVLLKGLIENADFSFGKSRSAQYGSCKILPAYDKSFWKKKGKISKGSTIAVTFLSDAVFIRKGDQAGFTVFEDEVRPLVKEQLETLYGIKVEDGDGDARYVSCLRTAARMGYMGVWNLRRPAYPVISAGSSLIFKLAQDCESGMFWLGEKQYEGFGTVLIENAEKYTYNGLKEADPEDGEPDPTEIANTVKEFFKPLFVESWLEKAQLTAIEGNKIRINISNSTLGRITMMLTESVEENKSGSDYDHRGAFRSFERRIRSIKSDSARKEGLRIVNLIGTGERTDLKQGLGLEKDVPEYHELRELGCSDGEINGFLEERWADYLLALLVDRKYKGRSEDEQN